MPEKWHLEETPVTIKDWKERLALWQKYESMGGDKALYRSGVAGDYNADLSSRIENINALNNQTKHLSDVNEIDESDRYKPAAKTRIGLLDGPVYGHHRNATAHGGKTRLASRPDAH